MLRGQPIVAQARAGVLEVALAQGRGRAVAQRAGARGGVEQVLERGLEPSSSAWVELQRAAAARADEHRVASAAVGLVGPSRAGRERVEHDDVPRRLLQARGERVGDDAAEAPADERRAPGAGRA